MTLDEFARVALEYRNRQRDYMRRPSRSNQDAMDKARQKLDRCIYSVLEQPELFEEPWEN